MLTKPKQIEETLPTAFPQKTEADRLEQGGSFTPGLQDCWF